MEAQQTKAPDKVQIISNGDRGEMVEVHAQVRAQVHGQVRDQVWDQVWAQVRAQVWVQAQEELSKP